MWGGLVLLVADDSHTGYSCLGPVCDALGTGGKEDVMGCSGCFLSQGQVHSEHHLTDTRESGKAGVCTLRVLPPQESGGYFGYIWGLQLPCVLAPRKGRSNNRV